MTEISVQSPLNHPLVLVFILTISMNISFESFSAAAHPPNPHWKEDVTLVSQIIYTPTTWNWHIIVIFVGDLFSGREVYALFRGKRGSCWCCVIDFSWGHMNRLSVHPRERIWCQIKGTILAKPRLPIISFIDKPMILLTGAWCLVYKVWVTPE